ncbi:Uncharacterised protein [Mycobacteroides abscessus subsp. abscessus]|nr:Uncharacterised protein [Mycobacteroides abscessus subsp. abscessus]
MLCTMARIVAAAIKPRTPKRPTRAMCSAPHGRLRDSEKMTAASAMSSTMPGAAGPAGVGRRVSRSPSTTPTVSRVASALNGAPFTGARLSRCGVVASVASGATIRCTAGMMSRIGS